MLYQKLLVPNGLVHKYSTSPTVLMIGLERRGQVDIVNKIMQFTLSLISSYMLGHVISTVTGICWVM